MRGGTGGGGGGGGGERGGRGGARAVTGAIRGRRARGWRGGEVSDLGRLALSESELDAGVPSAPIGESHCHLLFHLARVELTQHHDAATARRGARQIIGLLLE